MNKLEKWLSAAFLFLLLAAYGYWLFSAPSYSLVAVLASAVVCLLFGWLGVYAISSFVGGLHGQVEVELDSGLGRRSLRHGNRHPVLKLVFWILLARLAVYVVAYVLYTAENGYHGGLLDTLSLWNKGDAPHYLGIADNWYVTEGDPRFHIVFFPFYPICVRILNMLLHNTFASGMLFSLVCTVFSGVLLYELAILDLDRSAALRAVKYQMLLPAAFLLSAPMSDSLFLLLSLGCMLLARKKLYALACFIGGLAAFTRVLGVMLLVPVVVELFSDAVRVKLEGGKPWRFLLARIPSLLLIPAGLGVYLYINYHVTGDAFTFLRHQSEHWGQRMGLFFNTAAYQTEYLLNNIVVDRPQAFGLWLPNLLFLVGAPAVMLLSQRPRKAVPALPQKSDDPTASSIPPHDPPRQPYTMRASYLCYFLAYYAVGMGATWLLSAPRYLVCCFPLAIALAAKERPRAVTLLLYVLLGAAQVLYLWAYVAGWPVY